MAQKIYVGNLPFSTTEDQLRDLFAPHGEVLSVQLVDDRATGRPRGFGFVEMEDGRAAIQALNGQDFDGRTIRVSQAREQIDGGGGRGRW